MRSTQHKPEFRISDRQRGAVLLLVTFSLVVFFGLAALVIDLGRMYIVKSQLQNAADAGALRGALELNGTGPGVIRACQEAQRGALRNGFLLAAPSLIGGTLGTKDDPICDLSSDDLKVEFNTQPYADASWVTPATAAANPYDYYYIRVIASKTQIPSLLGGILGIWENASKALAVAGRFSPQGQILPLFIPVIRRNDNPDPFTGYNQLNGLGTGYPDCNGVVYDPKQYNKDCPGPSDPNWRGLDKTGNWGFLKPGETKSVSGGDFVSSSTNTSSETGGTYIIRLDPNAELDWTAVGTSWTGNFGYFLSEPPITTQKSLLDAVCTGTVKNPNTQIPGCRDLHTGGLSIPSMVESLNTRFDEYPKKDLDPVACPPDVDIQTYDIYSDPAAPPPPSAYSDYCDPVRMAECTPASVGISPSSPSHSGQLGRRVMRVYVIDNAWLRGYTDHNNSPCTDKLQGTVKPGHIVGCAEFFMWKRADKKDDGLFYGEFIRRVPDDECKAGAGPATYTEIRLFR